MEIAEVSLLARDTERSVLWAQRIIDEYPSCVYVLRAKAIAAHSIGDLEEASLCIEGHLKRFPFNWCSAAHLAQCRAEVGDRQGAIEAWRNTVTLDPFCDCEWRQLAKMSMTRVGIKLDL
jgi:hypothetical protein